MGLGGQRHAPAALPPGKTRYPLYRWLGGPQGRSGRVQKISPPPWFNPRTVHPIASSYTDCAIPAPWRMTGTLHKDHNTFLIISKWILLRMGNVSGRGYREDQNSFHIQWPFFFQKPCRLWDKVEDIVDTDRPQMTILCIIIASWITVVINTHS